MAKSGAPVLQTVFRFSNKCSGAQSGAPVLQNGAAMLQRGTQVPPNGDPVLQNTGLLLGFLELRPS